MLLIATGTAVFQLRLAKSFLFDSFFFACLFLGEEIIAYKPPGFNLMYHLLNESPMLELALSLLEEGVKQLDTYAPFPGMCLECIFQVKLKSIQSGI